MEFLQYRHSSRRPGGMLLLSGKFPITLNILFGILHIAFKAFVKPNFLPISFFILIHFFNQEAPFSEQEAFQLKGFFIKTSASKTLNDEAMMKKRR